MMRNEERMMKEELGGEVRDLCDNRKGRNVEENQDGKSFTIFGASRLAF